MEPKCFQEIVLPLYICIYRIVCIFSLSVWALAGIWCCAVNCLGSNNNSFKKFSDGIVLLIRKTLDQSHSVLGMHAP